MVPKLVLGSMTPIVASAKLQLKALHPKTAQYNININRLVSHPEFIELQLKALHSETVQYNINRLLSHPEFIELQTQGIASQNGTIIILI
jgi:hypothetical protein